jgi:hypothetical protein
VLERGSVISELQIRISKEHVMQETASDRQFTYAALTYFIEAARRALPVAPLPQFAACIQAIEWFRDYPNEDTHEGMVEAYELLRFNERTYITHPFTAVKEFFFGLRRILEDAVDGVENVSMSSTFAFTEAVYHAARALKSDAEAAQRRENAWQNALFIEVFPD